jgi:hypothetical protein
MNTTQTTHTPGPWSIEKAHHTDAEPDEHAIMAHIPGLGRCRIADVMSLDDARLIAQAPAMLAALYLALDKLEIIANQMGAITQGTDCDTQKVRAHLDALLRAVDG